MEHARTTSYIRKQSKKQAESAHSRMKRKPAKRIAAMLASAAIAAAFTVCVLTVLQPQGDTGSAIYPIGNMTQAQAQTMLDEQTAKSRMAVSLQPAPRLRDGQMYLNFTVAEDNNGWAERIEVEQDDAIIYRSGIVQPGYAIEWVDVPTAHVGEALATVYAVDEDGRDHGNPVSVEIQIETDSQQ